MVTLEFEGVPKVTANLLRASADKRVRAARRLYLFAEIVMTRSKTEFCPVDTGNLRASGHVRLPLVTKDELSVQLVYGGAASKYAVIVHEDLNVHHPVGQAKYLERPLLAMGHLLAPFVAAGLD